MASSRQKLSAQHRKHVPLVLKVAPDLAPEDIPSIAASVQRHGIDGIIATNTTLSREGVEGLPHATEAGGLSGAPLRSRATGILKEFSTSLPETTLIGAGGIVAGKDVVEKRAAGAALVQLYTGLIYRGPGLVAECVSAYRAK